MLINIIIKHTNVLCFVSFFFFVKFKKERCLDISNLFLLLLLFKLIDRLIDGWFVIM
jgi:hypothetical protein